MSIYAIIFFVCFVLALFEIGLERQSKAYRQAHLFFFTGVTLFLFLVAGFRECGFDYYNYFVYFEDLNNPYWFSRGLKIGSEPGYSLLNYSLGNYAAVIAFMSAAIIFIQFKFIYKYSQLPILSLLFYLGLFLYPSTMGQFRQALAIGMVLWAISNRENKTKFFLIIISAMMFHISAILGILVLFVPKQLLKTKVYILCFVVAVVCSLVAQTIYLNFITSLPPYVATKLAHYAAVESSPLGINTAVMIRAFVFFVCYYFKDKLLEIKLMPLFLNVYFLSLIIYTAMGFAPQVAGRGSIYFSFFEVIIVANLIFVLEGWKKLAFFAIFVGFSAYRQLQFFSAWTEDYLPFKNWFFDMFK